jgi:hypothetical protein
VEVSPNALRKEVVATLHSIEETITAVKQQAEDIGIMPEHLRYSDGTWPLIPLLLAKSQCLATLVALNEQGRRTQIVNTPRG